MSKKQRTTQGYSAIGWICDDCGCQNYEDMVNVEMTPFDEEEQPELVTAEWVMAPDKVVCSSCKGKFKLLYGDDE